LFSANLQSFIHGLQIAALYSALDEFHQTFVASRGPSAWDSLLDSTGALVALFTVFFLYRRFQRARAS
jgi:VanZ family protein